MAGIELLIDGIVKLITNNIVPGIAGIAVIINIIIYFLNKKQSENAKKLKEIDNQLLNVYLPMEKVIEDCKTSDPNFINIRDFESDLREIKTRNTGTFDSQVMIFSTEFFRSPPSLQNLNKFLAAVNYKILDLKKERQKCQ